MKTFISVLTVQMKDYTLEWIKTWLTIMQTAQKY